MAEASALTSHGLTASEASELTGHGGGSAKLTWATIDKGVEDGSLDQVVQHQMRMRRRKRKKRDATASGTPGVKRIVTDVLAELGYGKDAEVQKKVVIVVQGRVSEVVDEETGHDDYGGEETISQVLTMAQRKQRNLLTGGQGSGKGQIPQTVAAPPTAVVSAPILAEEARTIEESPTQVEEHEQLMGGMYLLTNTLLQGDFDRKGSFSPIEGEDFVPESQDDEFEEGKIKEVFRAKEYNGIYLELGLLLSCEMKNRDVSDKAQKIRHLYVVRDDHLFIKRQVRNPKRIMCGRNRQIDIIATLHDGIAGGHRGLNAMYAKISELYYWDEMLNMVIEYCQSCVPCQERSPQRPGEPLHPRLEKEVGAAVRLDLLFMPVGENGCNYIFDARDNLTGFVDGRAIRTKTGPVLASCIEEYYLCYPFVKEFVMDRGSKFTCNEVRTLLARDDGGHYDEEEPVGPVQAAGPLPTHGHEQVESRQITSSDLRGPSPKLPEEGEDVPSETPLGSLEAHLDASQWGTSQLGVDPVEPARYEPAEGLQGPEPGTEPREPGELQTEEVITVGDDTPPHTPVPEQVRQPWPEGIPEADSGEVLAPAPEAITSPRKVAETGGQEEDERAGVRTTVDSWLAEHPTEHSDTEMPASDEPPPELSHVERGVSAKAPARETHEARTGRALRETAEEKSTRVQARLAVIYEKKVRMEAAGVAPTLPVDSGTSEQRIDEMWARYERRRDAARLRSQETGQEGERADEIKENEDLGFSAARMAIERAERRIRQAATTSFQRYTLLSDELVAAKLEVEQLSTLLAEERAENRAWKTRMEVREVDVRTMETQVRILAA
ncbi:hypothetical protein CBR_g49880 [Chara braunii]|uniref:Integrase zinc-binding domain-containing protein n=1 Tax=Chara braunii TaxID=69332 RepID=A0A388JPA3_CHABU|nr:hypothetical protein CBR_g49880 [Chara braunii]|eukprot:GBG59615.1 hypothetical protein CBR_g49880 [Chara braunii]